MRRPKAEVQISLPFDNKWDAEALRRALCPETVTLKTSRALVRATRRENVLTMSFFSKDLVALRAMLNSYLRMAAAWRRVSEALDAGDNDTGS